MTVNLPNASPDSPSPISCVSSSWTTFTTCWPGVRLLRTSSPSAFTRTRATRSRTTVKFTSASSSARRISRIAREIDSSSSVPFFRRSPRALCSLSDRLSNTTGHRSRARPAFFTIGVMPYTAATERYERMQYRRSGRSGLQLPEISLGLWQNFGGDRPLETSRAILRRAFDLGVTHFDLANNYGPPYGSAEQTFGTVLREDLRPYRDELVISTKAG